MRSEEGGNIVCALWVWVYECVVRSLSRREEATPSANYGEILREGVGGGVEVRG